MAEAFRHQDINKPRSFGLRNIRERMLGLGGSLELASRSPQGTRMILRAPLQARHGRAGWRHGRMREP
jgi:signal transduction histidine kinase